MPLPRRIVLLGSTAFVLPSSGSSAAFHQGAIPPRPPFPPLPPFRILEPVVLETMEVRTEVKAGIASSQIELILRNPSDQPREGDLLLPIPEGAVVREFAAYDAERRLDAEILDREKARRIYEDIVRQRRDPALLEFEGLESVRVRVFPIQPRATRRLTLRLTHLLPRAGDSWRLETRFRGPHLPEPETVRWDILLHDTPHVLSPTHDVAIEHRDHGKTTVRFAAKRNDPALRESPSVLILATPAAPETLALAVSTFRDSGDGTFVLVASPAKAAASPTAAPARRWVLVMDRSGSMAGRKMEQARGALRAALAQLRPVDQFQLIAFSDKVDSAFRNPREATPANVAEAHRWVDDLVADAGTNIDSALAAGLSAFGRGESATVVFFTDGRPTVGVRDPKAIVASAAKRSGPRTRTFVFGVGYDVDVPFLDSLCGRLRGDADYVRPDEDIEQKASRFLTRCGDPLLSNPVLRIEGGDVRALCPGLDRLPDVHEGIPWMVAGRFRGMATGVRFVLEGETSAGKRRFVLDTRFPERATESEWVPQLWAARRIGELLDQIRLGDPDDPRTKELIESVVALSKEYGILTPYTAGFVPEPGQPARPRPIGIDLGMVRGGAPSGESAVNRSQAFRAQRNQAQVGNRFGLDSVVGEDRKLAEAERERVRWVAGRVFARTGNQWVEAGAENVDREKVVRIQSFSPLWFALAARNRDWARWMSQGARVRVRSGSGTVVEFGESGLETVDDALLRRLAP